DADHPGEVVRVLRDGGEVAQSYARVRDRAERVLAALRARGARPGESVLLQVEHAEDFVAALWGCLLGGFLAVPVSIPPHFDPENHVVQRLREVWSVLDRPRVVAGDGVAERVRRVLPDGAEVAPLGELEAHAPDPEWHRSEPEATAVLLLSSGTTGRPKLIRRTHRNLLLVCEGSVASAGVAGRRITFLNWLPLDHNAALMASLTVLAIGGRQVHLATQDVLEDPVRWLDALHRYRVTHTGGTNYSLGLVNGRLRDARGRGWDFSCVERIAVTAEPVVARTARAFLRGMEPFGLRADVLRPSYGMSEVGGIARLPALRLEETSDDDAFVEVGHPFPGVSLRVVDAGGRIVPEGTEGRIQVRGESVMPGYLAAPGEDRAGFTDDGWFDTGDAGFLRGGSLTITGREKDVLIVNGLNLHSQEIEAVVEEVHGVERACTAACAVRGEGSETDEVALFVHTALTGADERAALRRELRRRVAQRFGVQVARVLLVGRDEIPRTPLGKIRRPLLRRKLEAGEFAAAADEDAGSGPGPLHLPPRTGLEREICALWEEVLGVERVGVHDNFFDLGGHSLPAAQLLGRARAAFGAELTVHDLFLAPTPEGMALAVASARAADQDEDELLRLLNEMDASPAEG
ncbi:MAG TPA: non-ribosomal peptide synthetase, partial [Longimicrobiaceae bacterium]|nr:non-ribosomal peptide synthetase [Longimicrobiaceae bacterium]